MKLVRHLSLRGDYYASLSNALLASEFTLQLATGQRVKDPRLRHVETRMLVSRATSPQFSVRHHRVEIKSFSFSPQDSD